jgi:hypothetical protein
MFKSFAEVDNNMNAAKQALELKFAWELLAEIQKVISNSGFNYSNHKITLSAGMGSVCLLIDGLVFNECAYRTQYQFEYGLYVPSLKFLMDLENELTYNYYDMLCWLDGELLNVDYKGLFLKG